VIIRLFIQSLFRGEGERHPPLTNLGRFTPVVTEYGQPYGRGLVFQILDCHDRRRRIFPIGIYEGLSLADPSNRTA
jgi:hypothetical protein